LDFLDGLRIAHLESQEPPYGALSRK
jgi:hypothetical protein